MQSLRRPTLLTRLNGPVRYRPPEGMSAYRDPTWRRYWTDARLELDQALRTIELTVAEGGDALDLHVFFQRRLDAFPLSAIWPAAYARALVRHVPAESAMIENLFLRARASPQNRLLGITEWEEFATTTQGGLGEVDAWYRAQVKHPNNGSARFVSQVALEWARFAAVTYEEPEQAATLFDNAWRLWPADVLPLVEMAELFIYDYPDDERAFQILDRARNEDPEHPVVLATIAAHYERRNFPQSAALDLFHRAFQNGLGEPHLLSRYLYVLAFEANALEQAVAVADQSLARLPDSSAVLVAAAAVFQEAGINEDRIEGMLTQAVELAPDNAEALCRLAEYLGKSQGNAREAVALFERSIHLDDRSASTFGVYAVFARNMLNDSRFAAELYQRSLEIEPDRPATLHNLAILHLNDLDEPGVALQLLERALATHPNHAPSHGTYARVLNHLGRSNKEQKRHLELALRNGSRNPADFADLANLNLRDGEIASARVHLNRALEMDPSNYASLNRYGLFCLSITEDLGEAEIAFTRAIEVNEKGVEARNNLALTMSAMHRPASLANQLLLEAVRINPQATHAWFNLAILKLREGLTAEADQHIEHALETRDLTTVYLAGLYYAFYRMDLKTAKQFFDGLPPKCSLGPAIDLTRATYLIATGDAYEGMKRFMKSYLVLSEIELNEVTLLQSYMNYLFEPLLKKTWLKEVQKDLAAGKRIRTVWPRDTAITTMARNMGHPESEWLERLNAHVFGNTTDELLLAWPAWQEAGAPSLLKRIFRARR